MILIPLLLLGGLLYLAHLSNKTNDMTWLKKLGLAVAAIVDVILFIVSWGLM